ncbi:acyltransferase 3 [Pseudobacteroides cellulosolvens ATCC 35603 = DSM 2933]|uniref:Acyltransferase 3 n=1 Tax=Pseudobacteroides cellulosolvens ATCC 35603 = DSM 2933 TaxID=398512 RepID=A0A0L6JUZ9_9FIRM|nr:acyltransferase 3 [Pseudobacteroides cellulosolvens ATCC 35603 = DSM 2933]
MKRESGLDLLRTFAIFFVIGVHFFLQSNFYEVPISGGNMTLQVALRSLFMICVPLFLMLTGYLQIEKKPEIKYFKKIIPILAVYLFYSVLSIFMRVYYLNEDKSLLRWVAEILVFNADKYSWYINMYIGLFLITPFLNMIHNNLKNDGKNYKRFLLILVILTGLPVFFKALSHYRSYFIYLSLFDYWLSIYPITYYFLGAFIREYKPKFNKKLSAVLLILIIMFETIINTTFSRGKLFLDGIGEYGSIIIMIEAVLFFLIFYDIKINNNHISKILGIISILSLDIYMCSYISDKLVYTYFLKNLYKSQQQILYYFIFIVMISFTIAFTVSYLRHKVTRLIPVQKA